MIQTRGFHLVLQNYTVSWNFSLVDGNNPYRAELNIRNLECKVVQYADDTPLILNGIFNSMQAALNTLEFYNMLSDLIKH